MPDRRSSSTRSGGDAPAAPRPKEWADMYRGKFDKGWDKLRDETFARQRKLGVIPSDCDLPSVAKEFRRGTTSIRH
jgi:arylsulfatase A-like enzyme